MSLHGFCLRSFNSTTNNVQSRVTKTYCKVSVIPLRLKNIYFSCQNIVVEDLLFTCFKSVTVDTCVCSCRHYTKKKLHYQLIMVL